MGREESNASSCHKQVLGSHAENLENSGAESRAKPKTGPQADH